MKTKILVFLLTFFLTALVFCTSAKAQTLEKATFDIEIEINDDATFDITEKITNTWSGLVHGHRREVPLSDYNKCANAGGKACLEAIDTIIPLGALDGDGDEIGSPDFRTYMTYTSSGENLMFEWEIWSNGKNLYSEEVEWTIKYRVLGGIVWEGEYPYFYWNVIPTDRGAQTEYANVRIKFPENIKFNKDKFEIYNDYGFEYNSGFSPSGNFVDINIKNLPSFGPFTVQYQFEPTDLEKPGSLVYDIKSPFGGNSVYLDGALFSTSNQGEIRSFPSGEHELKFEHFGYKTETILVNAQPGEEVTLEISLEPTPIFQILIYVGYAVTLMGCLLLPFAPIWVYLHYRRKGRDKDMPKTIIPLFKPPADVRPYLLGSIRDEKVDRSDVIGSIIDLAYRGYIKIKEVKEGKNYELTKLKGKDGDSGLNDIETEIIDALFGDSETIETKDLRTTFPYKYKGIESKIYQEMLNRKYFNNSPVTVRGAYLGLAIFLIVVGIISAVFVTITGVGFLGSLFVFTPGIFIAFLGFGYFVASFFMPSKTAEGSKIYAEILGFRMYLYTTERYRLQNLKPEDFEKYLSFAIVFGIEKQWAEKFKDINLPTPDWYEGTGNLTDAILISNFTRSFTNSTVTNFTPVSSGSSSGGSSFSGSFGGGGFSGGGGGGGSSGGW